MFTLRREQVALLARNFNAARLIEEFGKRGLAGDWKEGGEEIAFTDARGFISRLRLDDHGRIAEVLSPSGERQQFAYDGGNRPAAYRDASGSLVQWTWDEKDRLASVIRNQQQRWVFQWDDLNNLTAIAYPDQSGCTFGYYLPNVLYGYRDRAGQTSYFERDEQRRLTAMTRPSGARTQYAYSRWDRPDSIVYPDGAREEHRRDAEGRLVEATVNGAPWARIDWAATGQPRRFDYGDGHFVELAYDAAGRVIEGKTPDITVRRRYDERDHLLEEDQGGEMVRYGYDAAGLLASLTTPPGDRVEFRHDADGRLCGITDWNGGLHAIEYARVQLGGVHFRQERRHLACGAVCDLRHREADRPEWIEIDSRAGFSKIMRFAYDINGRIATIMDSEVGGRDFHYDADGRLSGVARSTGEQEAFVYDSNGNCVQNIWGKAEYNSSDQLLSQAGFHMAYDARGNLVEMTGPQGTTRYRYNGQNLMTAAMLPDGRMVEYFYDAFARRIAKKTGNVTTRYVWAGDQLLCEWTTGGAQDSRCDYLFSPGTDVPFALRRDGQVHCYITDAIGTPRWLLDEAGKLAWSADCWAFGATRTLQQTVAQPLRFAGHYYDEETGLHYNRARYYSPWMGRYLSRDPLGIVATLNLYTYCHNDPINHVDPLGLWNWGEIVVGAALVAAGAALLVVAGPVVLGLAAATAAEMAMGIASVAIGGGAIGAGVVGMGIGFGVVGDGCLECQNRALLQGIMAGAAGALALFFPSLGGGAAGGMALANMGKVLVTNSMNPAMAVATTGIVMMATQGGAPGNKGSDDDKRGKMAGNNAVQSSGNRVNSDLPGGQQAARAKFNQLTEGQNTNIDPKTGHTVADDGTRLRINPNGTARIDRPASVTGGQHETIHFNAPD